MKDHGKGERGRLERKKKVSYQFILSREKWG